MLASTETLNVVHFRMRITVSFSRIDPRVIPLTERKSAGHQIGSHTWAHKDLSTLSWDNSERYETWTVPETHKLSVVHDEMWRVELAMIRILGVSPAFMRPPYGNFNDLVRSASAIRGQSLVIWDFE